MATQAQSDAWLAQQTPANQALIRKIANLSAMSMNAQGDGRIGTQIARKNFAKAGGQPALDAAMAQLQANPNLYSQWQQMGIKTGGLGQGSDILATLALLGVGAGTGLLTPQTSATIGGSGAAGAATQAAAPVSGSWFPGTVGPTGQVVGGAAGATAAAAPTLAQAAMGAGGAGAGAAGAAIPAGGQVLADGTILDAAGTVVYTPSVAGSGGGGLLGGLSNLTGLSPSTLGSLGSAAASIYGGQQAAKAANQAAQTYANAGNLALAEQARQFGISQANQAPWLTAGQQGLNQQMNLMGLGPQGAAGMNQALLQTPEYQWAKTQGQKAQEASLAARGGMGSGKALTAAQDWGQGLASQQYGNVLQRMANLSTMGQNTAAGMGTQGMQYAGNVGQIGLGTASAQANAGLIGNQAQMAGLTQGANTLANLLNPNLKTQSTLGY